MAAYHKPIKVFLSYAHKDKWLLQQLEHHLSTLKYDGFISTWVDREIMPGTKWAGVIDQQIEQASLILLLISADFLASDYCYQIEMKRALERYQMGQAMIIPIVARPTDWQTTPIAELQSLPIGAKPITTWDNQDEALLDVAIGIRKAARALMSQTPDSSTKENGLVSSPHPTPFSAAFPEVWNVPRRHSSFFTGRESALEHLANNFHTMSNVSTVAPQAITGLGGMGKTQVAVEYAYRWRGNYQAVLWVRAETQASLLADMRTVADLLKLPQQDWHNETSLIRNMQEWLRTRSNWLLIFDNVDNPTLLEPFLLSPRGHLLATTRTGAIIPLAPNPVTLKALADDDGALCILRRAGLLTEQEKLSAAHPADIAAAHQLSQTMEGLPLALEQAGAYINDTECGVRGYQKLYATFRMEIQPGKYGVLREYSETVVSVWRISQQTIEQTHPEAIELLRLCAFLSPDGIPDEMIVAGASALGPELSSVASNLFRLNASMSVLRKYSLLNRDVDREIDMTRISIHRIMQEVLIDEMNTATQRTWAEKAVRMVEQASQSMSWFVLKSQARHCQRLIEQWHMNFAAAKRLLQWIEKNERRERQ